MSKAASSFTTGFRLNSKASKDEYSEESTDVTVRETPPPKPSSLTMGGRRLRLHTDTHHLPAKGVLSGY